MVGRRPFLLSTALIPTLALAACAGGSAPSPDDEGGGGDPSSTNLTYRSWSPIAQTTSQMIDVFTESHPDVTIEATIFNYPEYLVDLQTRATSNTMPDIVGLQPGAMTQQFRSNLVPLQDYAASTWGEDWESMFYPIGLEQARAGNPEGDENYYGLPLLVQTVNLWANSQVLDENGLETPKTWDELAQAVEVLEGTDVQPFLMPAKDAWMRLVVFLQIANNIEPGLVYQAESGETEWTNPRIVEAFEYWQKLFTDGIAQEGALGLAAYPNAVNQFEAGDVGMIPLGAWWIQQSDPSREGLPPLSEGMVGYEPFLFPTIPGGATEPQLVGGIDVAIGISQDAANPELAWEVVADWIAGDGAQVLINTFNDLPAVKGLNPEEFTSEKQKDIWNLFVEDWMPEVHYSRYMQTPQMEVAITDALAAITTGEMTPEQAAQAVQNAQE